MLGPLHVCSLFLLLSILRNNHNCSASQIRKSRFCKVKSPCRWAQSWPQVSLTGTPGRVHLCPHTLRCPPLPGASLHHFSVLGNAFPSLAWFSIPPHPCFLSQILKAQWHLPFLLSGSLWGFGATSTAFLSDFPDPPSSLLSPLLLPSCGSFLPLPASYPTAASHPKHFFWPSKPPHLKLIWNPGLCGPELYCPGHTRFCAIPQTSLQTAFPESAACPCTVSPFQLLYGVDVTAFPPAPTDTPASAFLSHHSAKSRVQSGKVTICVICRPFLPLQTWDSWV